MKIYISLPISGHNLDGCRRRAAKMKKLVEALGNEVVTPFDVCPDSNLDYATYMGRDIEALLCCDAIFLLSGWSTSRGCQLEREAARIYNKTVYQNLNDIYENS